MKFRREKIKAFIHTSFRVTGFSINTTCVSLAKFCNGSRSANSAMLFAVSTSVSRFGIEVANVGWMWFTRLRASNSVRKRGKKGKFESEERSLSVKSIASCSYSAISKQLPNEKERKSRCKKTLTLATARFSIAGILWPKFVSKRGKNDISMGFSRRIDATKNSKAKKRVETEKSKCSICSSQVINDHPPLRSSSRSFIGLMYEREL